MNRIIKVTGLLRYLTIVGLVGATASTAAAYEITYCDGYNDNNKVSVSGATCQAPNQVDCWEDPSHNPPQWASGTTYARGKVTNCSGVVQVWAYKFQGLETAEGANGATDSWARAEGFDSSGISKGYATDNSANGAFGSARTATGATYMRVTGRLWY